FFDAWRASDPSIVGTRGSRIEGIGRPRVEPSFVGQVVDRMIKVPDAGSIAAARHASTALGRKVGGSTGTNLWGAFALIAEMMAAGRSGSVVTLLCDGGERYSGTYYNDEWVASEGIDLLGPTAVLDEFVRSGAWTASS
ncbi:PLP-dependent cysteine synthase family protein, partial [Rhodococcus erythropolis]|nr:PLP-dependent cysteine synthase family protein [Rhodococcus erythropolis]